MIKCEQCGSQSFYQESKGVLRCSDCFTKIEYPIPSSEVKQSSTREDVTKQGSKKKQGSLRSFVIAGVSLFFYFMISNYLETWKDYFFSSQNQLSIQTSTPSVEPTITTSIGGKDIDGTLFVLEELTPVPDGIGNVYFIGYVKNNSTFPSEKPKVNVYAYDKNRNKVGQTFGYAASDILLPGARSMLQILLKDSPKFVSFDSNVEAKTLYFERGKPNLALIDSKLEYKNSSAQLVGSIRNDSDQAVQFVNLSIIFKNNKKKIIRHNNSYLPNERINAGEEVKFVIPLYFEEKDVRSYDVEIDGMFF